MSQLDKSFDTYSELDSHYSSSQGQSTVVNNIYGASTEEVLNFIDGQTNTIYGE